MFHLKRTEKFQNEEGNKQVKKDLFCIYHITLIVPI